LQKEKHETIKKGKDPEKRGVNPIFQGVYDITKRNPSIRGEGTIRTLRGEKGKKNTGERGKD